MTIKTYERLTFWYPVKIFGAEILFVIPLLLLTIFWSRRSIKKENGTQVLISSHFLWILAIFILLKLLEFIYDILPHAFIQKFLDFLEIWNIIGLWYYILIFLAIVVTMGIIFFVQKKVFSRERLEFRRTLRGECYDCGTSLMKDAICCIQCWLVQKQTCPHCKEFTPIRSKFCIHCGKSVSEMKAQK